MNKIEVGEYIRTIDGYIRKVININEKGTYKALCYGKYLVDVPYKNSLGISAKKIKSHSKNIIDIIEKEDYINGYKVEQVFIDPFTRKKRLQIEGTEVNWQGDMSCVYLEVEEIKSILTHKLYEENCYKVGDIE